jgi:glycosyltransferase involved in cell wall biosynthesis
MRVLLLEPFYGGSHRDVADGFVAHSGHQVTLLTLPARFWKWRMRGASLWFAREPEAAERYDVIFTSGLLDVAALRSLLPQPVPPVVLYAHETQLTYPDVNSAESDLHFPFTDVVNMLAADHVVFNSHSHRDAFLAALPEFLRRLPEYRPMWAADAVADRSSVIYPGIREEWLADGTPDEEPGRAESAGPLLIWNHRWEHDKAPEAFFDSARELADRGLRFRLALLGENFKTMPEVFGNAREEFGDLIVQFGYVADRGEYVQWLRQGTLVVSTAIQENFGISIMEAVAHGCHPVVPDRLSYPELMPEAFHADCIYGSREELERLIAARLDPASPDYGRRAHPALVQHARSFGWTMRVAEFDALLERAAGGSHAH